jgi:hypothetical protein
VTRTLAGTALVIGLAIAGCGGDDSGETTTPPVSIPAITAPIPATTTAAATTSTSTAPTTSSKGGNNSNPKQPDSATNDVPPPPGSPQEAFEKQCEQNPAACG